MQQQSMDWVNWGLQTTFSPWIQSVLVPPNKRTVQMTQPSMDWAIHSLQIHGELCHLNQAYIFSAVALATTTAINSIAINLNCSHELMGSSLHEVPQPYKFIVVTY